MKKKLLFILLIVISLMLVNGCKKNEIVPYEELKDNINDAYKSLSNKEKESINYEELLEDVESLETNHILKHAVYNAETQKYNGNGYYIEMLSGGEVNSYVFYTSLNNKRFYVVDVFYFMSER